MAAVTLHEASKQLPAATAKLMGPTMLAVKKVADTGAPPVKVDLAALPPVPQNVRKRTGKVATVKSQPKGR